MCATGAISFAIFDGNVILLSEMEFKMPDVPNGTLGTRWNSEMRP